MPKAEGFYDLFLAVLGFDISLKSTGSAPAHDFEVIEYPHENLIFAINSPRSQFKDEAIHRRKPGALHHLAFKANSEMEVDDVYEQLRNTHAIIVADPQFYPQHGAHYYALFIKDLDGIKYEIVYEERA